MTKEPELTIPANELATHLDDIRIAGGFVTGLSCTPRNGVYKVRIHWPPAEQQAFTFAKQQTECIA
jgi:hypothetical protein